jgi:molybdopterin converting factor small subunit
MAQPSRVAVQIPGQLREYCGGLVQLTVHARSVRAALAELERTHAALYRNICDERGVLRRHLNVFVNADNIRDLDGINSALTSGDVVTILPAVSGG